MLEGEELEVYNFWAACGRSSIDMIAMGSNLTLSKVAGILIKLELKQLIRPLAGKEFELIKKMQ